jgi:hypothetical protein
MSGYLEAYGAGEEKRARLIKRTALVVILVLATGAALYFGFRNYREKQQAKLFVALLQQKNYQAAYALWGCTPTSDCRSYTMDKFMEDWGPKSTHADPSKLQIVNTRGCSGGVIFEMQSGAGEPDYLWVERSTRNLAFAPLADLFGRPVCDPRVPNASMSPKPK